MPSRRPRSDYIHLFIPKQTLCAYSFLTSTLLPSCLEPFVNCVDLIRYPQCCATVLPQETPFPHSLFRAYRSAGHSSRSPMATTTAPFPLATGDPTIYDGPSSSTSSSGTAEGASGSSPGAVEISHGGMVAIIVVVSVVAVLGSKFLRSECIRQTKKHRYADWNSAQSPWLSSFMWQRSENGRSEKPCAALPERSSQH